MPTATYVSPGFTPRPWLSEHDRARRAVSVDVSPGFTPRPWLSAPAAPPPQEDPVRVAGVHAPALVERSRMWLMMWPDCLCRRGSRPGLG